MIKGNHLIQRIAYFLPKHAFLCWFYKVYALLCLTCKCWRCLRILHMGRERMPKCLQDFYTHITIGRHRDGWTTTMSCELRWPTQASRQALTESYGLPACYRLQCRLHPLSLSKLCMSTCMHGAWYAGTRSMHLCVQGRIRIWEVLCLPGMQNCWMPCHLPWGLSRTLQHLQQWYNPTC